MNTHDIFDFLSKKVGGVHFLCGPRPPPIYAHAGSSLVLCLFARWSLCQFMLDADRLPQLKSAFLPLPQHIHYQSSLFSKHILLLFSLFVRTTLIYFPALLFVDISPNLVSLPIPILASFVPPHIHLNILIYTTSNFFSCIFYIARVSLLALP